MNLIEKFINVVQNKLINVRTTFNPFQILRNVEDVTPSDSADLDNYGILHIGGGGTVKVDLAGSGTRTYTIESGEFYPIIVKKVYATGTTATDIAVHW